MNKYLVKYTTENYIIKSKQVMANSVVEAADSIEEDINIIDIIKL